MIRSYRAILRLYPHEYRAVFASEMVETFDQAASDWRKHGHGVFLRFAAGELAGLLRGVGREWISKWTACDGYMDSRWVSEAGPNWRPEIGEIQGRLRRALRCMEFAIAYHDFPEARRCSDEERALRAEMNRLAGGPC